VSFCKDKNHKNCGFQQCGQLRRSEVYIHDKFEEFKWVIKSRKSKNIRYNDPKKEKNNMINKTMIYRTMHRKLEIEEVEQHESYKAGDDDLMCSVKVSGYCSTCGTRTKPGMMISCAP
jgi:hypothetical protein